MSFKDITIKNFYRSNDSNIAKDFLDPMLKESITYCRAVGFFSSSSFIKLAHGIDGISKRINGKIRLIVSPKLSESDVEAINSGYINRDMIVEKVLLTEFDKVFSENEVDCLALLSSLITSNVLDIKVALIKGSTGIGMYHEKIGYFKDEVGNRVSFIGSLNESENSFSNNFESIVVFKDWIEFERASEVANFFDELWDKNTENDSLVIYEFPKAVKEKIFEFQKVPKGGKKSPTEGTTEDEHLPISLYDYQIAAIKSWEEKGFRGIYDMATGSGKTYTALQSIIQLKEHTKGKLATVVICPYQHLVEQWEDEASKFRIYPIIGFSQSSQKDWYTRLESVVADFNDDLIMDFCFFTTNGTFKSDRVQKLLKRLKGETLFIADEAHNVGAIELGNKLLINFKYRLALSATVDRHRDELGTEIIYEYFGEKCIEYSLERAISEKKLTPYKYYPIVTCLNSDELDDYVQLTHEMGRSMTNKNGKAVLSDYGNLVAIKRARIVAGSINKVFKLKEIMKNYIDKSNILVYCGTASLNPENNYIDEVKQITYVCDMLGNELNMRIEKYTSEEKVHERKIIKGRFERGEDLQVLVAIKCLDEGVDIPSIKTAFILASSTNPREYIQRRGRVLRKYQGKEFAEVYDFVTLPFPMDGQGMEQDVIKSSKSLLVNEITRMENFNALSMNPGTVDTLIADITNYYSIDEVDFKNYEEIVWEDI